MEFQVSQRRKYKNFQISILYQKQKVKDCYGFLRTLHAETHDFMTSNPLNIDNELKVLTSLREAAMLSLIKFPGNLKDDEKLLKDEKEYPRRSNKRHIVLMRKSEKEVLTFYIELKSKIEPLLNMSLNELMDKLKSDEIYKDNKSPLMQYINAVVVPLKQKEERLKRYKRK